MEYSKQGLALTEQFEGCSLTAYSDPVGVLTIGYGHTGPDVTVGLTWTLNQCQIVLIRDIQTAVDAVNKLVTVELDQNKFDALVDFTFNVGVAAFAKSTLLLYINHGNWQAADAEFCKWVHAGTTILPGLVKRRLAEANLFNT